MRKSLSILLMLICGITYSQTTVSGSVLDDSSQPLPGANVIVIGTSSGDVTDFDGNFTFKVNQEPPFSVQASSVGFESVIIEVTENNQVLNFVLNEGNFLDEVVISASRPGSLGRGSQIVWLSSTLPLITSSTPRCVR